ncbi:MAG: hypothetical protein RBR18_14670 [Desulfovibrionaceae bacterium]|nr:hypothetical protein [Desulfovibrionaceae bacterium]
MRNSRANLNLMAVSMLLRETAINTPQTLSHSLLVDVGDYLNLDVRRESNADEANGREEPDLIYDNGATASGSFNFNKLQPHQAGLILAYGLGSVSTAAAGSGYAHTITPINGDLDLARSNPSFTAAQRIGQTLNKRRFASCFIDSFSMTFAADDWVKAKADIKGTGLYADTVIEEEVEALDNATSLTLAANGVQGATAAERLDNVQVVRATVGGGVQFATVSAVSAATPAVLTISSLGGSGATVTYKVLYTPTEPAWATFPARVTETPLRVAQACLYLGGSWSGSAFVGGKQLASELSSFEWTCNNNLAVEFTPCAGGSYAGRAYRGGRNQIIKLSRELRDWLVQQYMGTNETFGLHLLCEGAEYTSGHKYTVELIFPQLGVLSAPLSTNGKRVAEAGDLQVLQHATYGSVIARVKNLVATYAA